MPRLDDTIRALLEANLALAQELDSRKVLQVIVETARRLIGASYVALGVISNDGRSLTDFVHVGLDSLTVERIGPLPTGKGVLGSLLHDARILRLADLADHPDSVGFPAHHPAMTSFLGLPIEGRDGIVGNLYLTNKVGGDQFTEDDEAIAQALAAMAAASIGNARLYTSERQRASKAAALVGAVGALVRERDPGAVLNVVVEAARELVDAEYAALGILSADHERFDRFIHAGMDPATADRIGSLPVGLGVLRAVTIERRAIRLDDLSRHPASVGFPPEHPAMTSFLGVPLLADGEVLGNLYLANKAGGKGFDQDDEDLVLALTGQAAIALERARVQERDRAMVGQLRSLLRVNLILTQELDVDIVLQTLVDRARDLVDAEYAALGVLGEDGDSLDAFIHSGMDPELVRKIGPLPRGLGVLRAVIVGKRPIRMSRMSDHPASVGFPAHHPPMDSFLGVPLEYQGRVLGNLYLTNKRGASEFSEEDERLCAALAAQAAIAIANARVYTSERDLVERLKLVDSMKNDFVSLVSHELRTPLVALLSGSDMLMLNWQQMEPEKIDLLLGAVNRQALRLQHLITNLLDLGRVEQGRLRMSLRAVDLADVVQSAVDEDPSARMGRVSVEIAAGLRVLADPVYLGQIASNLIGNALSYGGPNVLVTAEADDSTVRLVVADDGGPIDDYVVPTLFERFTRGPRQTDDTPGSGLGLALVRAFVEAFGGTVHYEPAADGWTRFVVRLRRAGRSRSLTDELPEPVASDAGSD